MFLISPTCSYIRISHISIFMHQLLSKNGKKRAWSLYIFNRIGGVMVSVFTSSAVNRWIEPRSVNLEMNYFIGTPGSPLCFELLIELVSESGWRRNFITKEIISIFKFWIFHLKFFVYIATFQQELHMEYTFFIFQLRYSRACGSYQEFLDRVLLQTRKLLNQWFLVIKLKSSLRKFYCRHLDFVNRYGLSVSQMITDMFRLP
jgi:hypothetical protein